MTESRVNVGVPVEPGPPASTGTNEHERVLIHAALRQAQQTAGHPVGGSSGDDETVVLSSRPTPGDPGSPGPPQAQAPAALPSDALPGYEILREIHRGGQGVVYQALQKATRRKVAIKVMREGPFAGPRDRVRFEREVQILGQLSHPNIVGIHDSGTSAGNFYFVMDYISGYPLDVYMASRKFAVAETLELFAKVCDAVNAAHLRGVIHRDLKPSNIRVDADGQPHVLDFGLAKTVLSDATDGSDPQPMTVTGQFVGTLAWASPEQAEGSPSKIDLRTDVYSLGVILFQMLTGRFPYDVVGSMPDVLNTIRRGDPVRPRSLRKQVDDEVETIVLKCLAKERDRRYQTAGELGRDIGRYLVGAPIEAKRDSGLYVVRKLLGRYKRQALVAAVFVAFLALGGTTVWKIERASRLREAATIAAQHARDLVDRADQLIASHKRKDFAAARELLDQAVGIAPQVPVTFRARGRLEALQGLDAPLGSKVSYVERAAEQFRLAHWLAGGGLPDEMVPLGHVRTTAEGRGAPAALRSAAQLLLLARGYEEARPFLALAESASGDSASAGPDDESAAELPIYELDHDPLYRNVPPNPGSPAALGSAFDEDAVVTRALKYPVSSLNPMQPKNLDFYVTELLFDPLFVVNSGPECERNPAMVREYIPPNAALVSTVILQSGLSWHDGEPLTAADIVFSWGQVSDRDKRDLSLVAVRRIDDLTVEFQHGRPVIDPEWDLTFPIVPEHYFNVYVAANPGKTLGDAWREFGRHPVGNGPFMHVAREPGEWRPEVSDSNALMRVELERWPGYPDEQQPWVKTVIFRVIEQRSEQDEAFAAKEVDELELSASQFQWDVNGESFAHAVKLVDWRKAQYDYICWNVSNPSAPFLADPAVRVALTQAMDLEAVRGRFGNLFAPFRGIFAASSWMEPHRIALLPQDTDAAERALERAGWRSAADGMRAKGGQRLAFDLLVSKSSPEMVGVANDLAAQLRPIGVAMNVQVVPKVDFDARRADRSFHAFVGSVIDPGHPDASRKRWTTGAARNFGGYSNKDIDRLYDEARSVASRQEQARKYSEIQNRIYTEQPYTFLWQRPTLWAINKRLRGVEVSPLGLAGFWPGARAWWVAVDGN